VADRLTEPLPAAAWVSTCPIWATALPPTRVTLSSSPPAARARTCGFRKPWLSGTRTLYLVAPDERREKVITEVNRPTFSRLNPPMSQMCRYIAFSELRQRVAEISSVMRISSRSSPRSFRNRAKSRKA